MRQAIGFLALAKFRGFAHLEKIYEWDDEAGENVITSLSIVEQWHWCRRSMYSPWEYVADARQTNMGVPIDYSRFIIRECERPLNEIALISFIYHSLVIKDMTAFVEIYGIPASVVIGPPNVPKEKEKEYQEAGEKIAMGSSGFLPHGSDVKWPEGVRGQDPFTTSLETLEKQLVLAGTGGLLTMLTAPTGIGKGPTDAHEDAFKQIARCEGLDISEIFQRQLDAEILEQKHPGQPALAYMEISIKEETDVAAIVQQALELSQAGYQMPVDALSELTGYALEKKEAPAAPPSTSSKSKDDDGEEVDEEDEPDEDDAPLTNRLAEIAGLPDNEIIPALRKFHAQELPAMVREQLRRAIPFKNQNPNHDSQNGQFASGPGGGTDKLPFASAKENYAHGMKSMDHVLATHQDIPQAMHRKEVGFISFRWGNEQGGIAHIVKGHSVEEARKMPLVIAHGKVCPLYESNTKRNITYSGYRAVLALQRQGGKETWLLTGFDEAKKKGSR